MADSKNTSLIFGPTKLTDHKDQVFHHLNDFRQQNLFCDVHFNVNGKIFAGHRLVLSSISPYFKTMFNGNFIESNSDTITMKDVETETFEEILNAMYTATIHIVPSNAYSILKTSHLLQLEGIEKACVSFILNNPKISYLVDTCIFTQNIGQIELHRKCIQTISENLSTYGRTECFKKIPIDVFKSILSCRFFHDKEVELVFLTISQWCEENRADFAEVRVLLELAMRKVTKSVSPYVMTYLIYKTYNSSLNEGTQNSTISNSSFNSTLSENTMNIVSESESKCHFDLNLCLNTVDVKTGERGWGLFKTSDDFSNYIFSSYHLTDSTYKKVCKVGSKIFCVENIEKKNMFSCYDENYEKTELKLPPCHFQSYDMATTNSSIYLVEKAVENDFIWTYNYIIDSWERKLRINGAHNFCALTSLDDILYVIANSRSVNKKHLLSFDTRSKQLVKLTKMKLNDHESSAICAFDNKIFLSGSNHDGILQNVFSIFDITANRWLTDVKPMNTGRVGHNLIHHNGFIYAIENNCCFVTNEKYDLKTNTWIVVPPLPEKFAFEYNDDIMTLSTGELFGVYV